MTTVAKTNLQEELNRKAQRKEQLNAILPFGGLILISAFFIIVTQGRILSGTNLQNLINQVFTVTLVSVGSAFVYGHGGMDFSIGASCGVGQLAAVSLIVGAGLPWWVGLLAAIVIGVLCSTAVGGLSFMCKVPVFVVSLCMKYVCEGVLHIGTQGQTFHIDYQKYSAFNNVGIKAVVLLAVVGMGWYLFEKTTLGKREKAIGGNPVTAGHAGVHLRPTILTAYALLGVCTGIAAFFQLTRIGYVSSTSGMGMEFDVMLAIVLGGFPMSGGYASKLRATVIGAVTMTILANGLVLWGVDYAIVSGVKGLLFVIIVAVSYDRSNMKQFKVI